MAIKDLKCIKIPMEFDPTTGDIAMQSGEPCIGGQILSVLSTVPGERPMQPLMGMRDNVFGVLAPIVTVADIEDQLQAWITSEARCEVTLNKDADSFENGYLDMTVKYGGTDYPQSVSLRLSDLK
jgi:phage baseplate assembly protein W